MPADRPVFYYDLASPYAWLAAERVSHVLAVPPIWQPVLASELPASASASARALGPRERELVERRAAALGLQAVRWPPAGPLDSRTAMLAATFAQQAGRVVAFSLAAFRQAFAAGRDLSVADNVLIAAAACELHPRAVLKGIESRSVRERLSVATEEAATRGVRVVPAVRIGARLFEGEQRVEDAARAAVEGQACADQPLE